MATRRTLRRQRRSRRSPRRKGKEDKEWKPEDGENGSSDVEPDAKQRKRPRKDTAGRGKERCDASGGGRDGARGRRHAKGKSEAKEKPTEQPDAKAAEPIVDAILASAMQPDAPPVSAPCAADGGVRRRRQAARCEHPRRLGRGRRCRRE